VRSSRGVHRSPAYARRLPTRRVPFAIARRGAGEGGGFPPSAAPGPAAPPPPLPPPPPPPALGDEVGQAGHAPPRLRVESEIRPDHAPSGIEDPAVHVELVLVRGGVPHADRSTSSVSRGFGDLSLC